MALPHTGSGGVTTAEIGGSFSYQPFCISTARMHNIAFPGADLLVAPGCGRCQHPQLSWPTAGEDDTRPAPNIDPTALPWADYQWQPADSMCHCRSCLWVILCFTYNIGADANLCNRTAAGFSHPLVTHAQAYPHTHTHHKPCCLLLKANVAQKARTGAGYRQKHPTSCNSIFMLLGPHGLGKSSPHPGHLDTTRIVSPGDERVKFSRNKLAPNTFPRLFWGLGGKQVFLREGLPIRLTAC